MILLGKRFDIFENGQKRLQVFGHETELLRWVRNYGAPSLSWLLAHGWVVECVWWDSLDAIQGSTQPLIGACVEDDETCGATSENGFACTLRGGHNKFHAAHTVSETHPLFAWSEVTG